MNIIDLERALALIGYSSADLTAAVEDAETAAADAENYAAAAATGAKFYDTIAAGLAAVADGATFGVKAGGTDGLKRPTVYRRDSATTRTALYSVLPASEFDATLDQSYSERSGYTWAVADNVNRIALAVDTAGRVLVGGELLPQTFADGPTQAALEADLAAMRKWVTPSADIACWGDSLTNSAGSTGATYTGTLAQILDRNVYTGGVGGQDSAGIAARQGGMVPLLTITDDTIPASGSVTVTATTLYPITSQGPSGGITGTLGGVPGKLNRVVDEQTGTGYYTFTRTTAGDAVTIEPKMPFWVDTNDYDFRTVVLWYGRNNFGTGVAGAALATAKTSVKDALAASIAFLKPQDRRFVILGVINQDRDDEFIGTERYTAMVELNEELKALYPRNFIDIRRILVRAYDPAIPDDVIDHGNDVPPGSLRSDSVHLNAAGYTLVGQVVADFITRKGW